MELFGVMADGKVVNSYELTNKRGAKLKVINYGATVTSLKIPLKSGEMVDVVLGFDTLENYINSFDLESALKMELMAVATRKTLPARRKEGTPTLS